VFVLETCSRSPRQVYSAVKAQSQPNQTSSSPGSSSSVVLRANFRLKKKGRPTMRISAFAPLSLLAAAVISGAAPASAQVDSGRYSHPRIVQQIEESKRVSLSGNVRPEAKLENDRGRVADSHEMEHMLLQLKRSPEQELALQKLLDELQ